MKRKTSSRTSPGRRRTVSISLSFTLLMLIQYMNRSVFSSFFKNHLFIVSLLCYHYRIGLICLKSIIDFTRSRLKYNIQAWIMLELILKCRMLTNRNQNRPVKSRIVPTLQNRQSFSKGLSSNPVSRSFRRSWRNLEKKSYQMLFPAKHWLWQLLDKTMVEPVVNNRVGRAARSLPRISPDGLSTGTECENPSEWQRLDL